jgi:hypothetical protein
MRVMRRFTCVAATLFAATAAAAAVARAQEQPQQPPPPPPSSQTPPGGAPTGQAPTQEKPASELSEWGFDLNVFAVDPPGHDPYTSGTLAADRDGLHLEGRWNYEALHTASLWVGANFEWES